jgi:HEAT repeat protein
VLTSNKFLEEAKDSLWASLRGAKLDKLVTTVDGNQLVALLEKHLPSAFWEEYDYFNKYFSAMKNDFETIEDISAIGQKEPVPLENIYVSLRLGEKMVEYKTPIEKERKIFEEELIKRQVERYAEREKIIDSERAVKDYDKLVIVGAPGSGKTTLLRHLALKSCRENLEKQERTCVPIPIELREFSKSGKDLREYIDEVFEKYQFPKAKAFVEKDLKEGKCMLLLDGFDELATKERQEKIAEQLQEFVGKYHKSQIIFTSRIAGYHDELRGFTKLELMEFDDKQIERFIENWFGKSNPEKAKSMFDAIKENEQIKALARNPLMIAIIAIIHEEDRELPRKRADLYNRCVEVLLSKWDVQKKLKKIYASEKKEFILRKLAFYAHSNNKRTMTEKEIIDKMLKYFPQVQLKREDEKPFLDEIWQRSYLLRQISMDSYDFLHLSFQEYFTALELKEQEDGISTIIKHLLEPWWEEPILLYAGISKDATALIKRIKKEVPEDIFYSNLMLFGKCVADADFTEPHLREEIINELWSLYQTAEFSFLKEKAIEVLALIKPDNVIDSLIKKLEDKDSDVRMSAAEALGSIGSKKAIETLINVLTTDKDSKVRESAAFALGGIGSEKAVESLINVLSTDKDSDVRSSTAFALGGIGSEKTIESLIDALSTDKESDIRWSATFALGRIGSELAIEPLIKALSTDKDSYVRWSAAFALGRIGSELAIEPLIKSLSTDKENSIVRGNVAEALGRIGSELAIEPLIKALFTDEESYVRWRAAEALGRIGSELAIGALIEALNTTEDSAVRERAADALGHIGGERAVELLIEALTTKEGDVRWRAAEALGHIGSEKAIELLIEALTTADSFIRRDAAEALGGIGSVKVIDPLIEALTTDKDDRVRWNAAKALVNIGDIRAVEPLKRALKDEGEWFEEKVKDKAFTSLEEISRRIKMRITIETGCFR